MKNFSRLSFLLIAFCVMASCAENTSKSKEAPLSISIEESLDSIVVKGVYAAYDSSAIVIPKSFSYEEYVFHDSETKDPWGIPSGLKWVRLDLGRINGYEMDVKLFPDDGRISVGYARYRLSSGNRTMTVDTGYDWSWNLYIEENVTYYDDCIQGRTYKLCRELPNVVQDDSEEILDCMFCFKDVDFDGEKELCFKGPGYNREYYNCYKILNGKIEMMGAEPYNNIVYGICGNTEFDYEAKTITVDEQMGCAESDHHVWARREKILDPLNPMAISHGYNRQYLCCGDVHSVIYEDGCLQGELRESQTSDPGIIIKAFYRVGEGRVYTLKTLSYEKDGEKTELFTRN